MISVHEKMELAIRLPLGQCAGMDLLTLLTSHGIRVLARSCYQDRHGCVELLIADNAHLAEAVLQAAGYTCRSEAALLIGIVPYRPGAVAELGWELDRAGVGILSSHLCPTGEDALMAVFRTTDNKQAVRVLNSAPLAQAA